MSIVSVENISKIFGEKVVLGGVSFGMERGEKIAVVGINGTGKSTLLKIIAGVEEPDEGQVIMENGLKIAYLPQTPQFKEDETILDYIISGIDDMADGWNLDIKAKDMLLRLGLTDYEKRMTELSGGEKKKVSLVRCLIVPSDLLILDEPTNHLDMEMVRWLEDTLKGYKGTLLMITHDRFFIDRVTDRILELDKGHLYSYGSNYSGFLLLKNKRIEDEINAEKKRQNLLRSELEWVRRGARARTTKQKARLQRFEDLSALTGPVLDQDVKMESLASRMGKKTIEIKDVSKCFGEKQLVSHFTYTALKNDCLGIVGPNGCGKTTLLKMIAGILKPDEGDVSLGDTIRIGYYEQETGEIDASHDNERVIDYIRDAAEYIRTSEGLVSASVMLERFLFPGNHQYRPIAKLSGGEKRRLQLLRILMTAPNVLLLDEPTNDLDIETLSVLEDFLAAFDGIIITVSHDRYFMDNVVTRILSFGEGGVITQYDGNYSDYAEKKERLSSGDQKIGGRQETRGEGKKDGAKPEGTKQSWNSHEEKLKFTYKEQKEFETIESDIEKLEERLEENEEAMLRNSSDFAELNRLQKEKEELEKQLEEKMERWEYLSTLAEKIRNQ